MGELADQIDLAFRGEAPTILVEDGQAGQYNGSKMVRELLEDLRDGDIEGAASLIRSQPSAIVNVVSSKAELAEVIEFAMRLGSVEIDAFAVDDSTAIAEVRIFLRSLNKPAENGKEGGIRLHPIFSPCGG